MITLPNLRVHHHPDPRKSRSPYLGLLKLGAEEDPTDARRSYYYGRKLFFAQQHEAAITELERYLALPGATWKEERAAALRHIARCHLMLGQTADAQRAAFKSVFEDGSNHESWLELAEASRLTDDWATANWAATKALAIAERHSNPVAWGWHPHDFLALSAYFTGHHEEAVHHGEAALALNPSNERLRKNLQFYRKALQRIQPLLPRPPQAAPNGTHRIPKILHRGE